MKIVNKFFRKIGQASCLTTLHAQNSQAKACGYTLHAARCTLFLFTLFTFLTFSTFLPLQTASAAVMENYCVTPPFVVAGVKPNLLMMLDNSSSMYDLNYVDQGRFTGTCSATTTQACSDTAKCPAGEMCVNKTFTRKPYYCYDQTYKSSITYAGYFETNLFYEYTFLTVPDNVFREVAPLPACAAGASYSIPNTLVVCVDGGKVTRFAARGNYLNWLTASKFDVQKEILTGGKHVTNVCSDSEDTACTSATVADDCLYQNETCSADPRGIKFLQAESRGCVGRKFVKEALMSDFVNYSSPETNNPNTSRGITFGIRGPVDPNNVTAPSRGGQTYIDVYLGNYNQSFCQAAIEAYSDPGSSLAAIKKAVDDCLSYTESADARCTLDKRSPAPVCKKDSDCVDSTGTCGGGATGTCSVAQTGICSTTTAGVCTANNGTCLAGKKCIGGSNAGAACTKASDCNSGVCSRACSGGGKAGSACNNDADCKFSSCTAGKPAGTSCTVNADCNVNTCTAGLVGQACGIPADPSPGCTLKTCDGTLTGTKCAADADCGTKTCQNAGRIGDKCSVDTDCKDLGICSSPSATTESKTKVVFNQTIQACWALKKGTPIGTDEVRTVKNQCEDLYDQNYTCTGGPNDKKTCAKYNSVTKKWGPDASLCPGGGCDNGPDAIRPGNPSYLCSSSYTGACAFTFDSWTTTNWTSNECIIQKHTEFCDSLDVPPVVDPTDAPSETERFDNLPAIISDIGIEAQLGQPIGTLTVQNRKEVAPEGLLNEFSDLIRFGAMSFNYSGSPTECSTASPVPAGSIPCPKKCSVTTKRSCTTVLDCPADEACIATTLNVDNRDGGMMIHNIGAEGVCSVTNTTKCSKDEECLAGEKCVSVGNHDYGLIDQVDRLRGATWTPFSEGFYNAIGYFARTNSYTESPGTSRTDLRINEYVLDGKKLDFDETKNPSQYECQANNILLVSDGMSTADRHPSVSSLATLYTAAGGETGWTATCPKYAGSRNLDNLAWIANKRNIKTFSLSSQSEAPPINSPLKNSEFIRTYTVFTGAPSDEPGECDSYRLLNQTAANGGTTSAKLADRPEDLREALRKSFQEIAARASSGTAASVLASGEGSGANLIQALFYPQRTIGTTTIEWTGSLQNFWYYIDPFLGNSSIREESNDASPPYTLNLKDDYILHFRFPASAGDDNTVADLWVDTDGDGVANVPASPATKYLDDFKDPANKIKYLWEAGRKLWAKAPTDRKIYTTTDGKETGKITLPDTTGDARLISHLQATNANEAAAILQYTKGRDLGICNNIATPAISTKRICDTANPCTVVGETCTMYRNRTVTIDGTRNTWKLGDIVNSTPKISSWMPMNDYHKMYNDDSYGPVGEDPKLTDPASNKHFISTDSYKKRGMVFVGGNDGMLHAFNLGTIKLFDDKFKKAELSGANLGEEAWAYIPRHALPYLKYLGDPNYCHLYLIDLVPSIFDVSMEGVPDASKKDAAGNSTGWRTILIGGMRFGGACKDAASASLLGVNAPAVVDGKSVGFSSYFALDITDQNNPTVLWEFSNSDLSAGELATGGLGFSTTGPAVVKVSAKTAGRPDNNKNGHWFVVIGSGPTGPIDDKAHQFKGFSDQNLKLFILDLKTGSLLRTIDTDIENAFAGSFMGGPIDLEKNPRFLSKPGFYQDDAVYFGYTKAEDDPVTNNTKWNKGGILRLATGEDTDPGKWEWSHVIKDIGPVTAAVSKLQNYGSRKAPDPALWLFFGSGRYYSKIGDLIDDPDGLRKIYGVKEPCFNKPEGTFKIDPACADSLSEGNLGDVTITSANATKDGWFIRLDKCTKRDGTEVNDCADSSVVFKAERMTTDPLGTTIGAVFYTTTKPTADVCEYGGVTHLWAVQYDTGGALRKGVLRGKVLLQVSTGSVEEKDLATALTHKKDEGATEGETVDFRKSDPIQGLSSTEKPQIAVPPQPMNKFIHIRER